MTDPVTRAAYDAVAALLRRSGPPEAARLIREPTELERFPAGHLLLRRPG